jgi:PAS domain S-box-containing protein
MTLAVAASAFWSVHLLHNAMLDAAEHTARKIFDRDALYLLTPVNMTREEHQLKSQEDGTLGHITSLKPKNPRNAPDAWETNALLAFEQGRTEAISREVNQGQPYLRFMKPVKTEQVCLACHGDQGYHLGDIRGGISVAVPLNPYLALARARTGNIIAAHAVLWAVGALGIFFGVRLMRQRIDRQLQAEAALRRSREEFEDLFNNAPIGFHELDTEGRIVNINQTELKMMGYSAKELLGQFVWKLSANEEIARKATLAKLAGEPPRAAFERIYRRKDGSTFPVLINDRTLKGEGGVVTGSRAAIQDYTERKRTEEALHQSQARYRAVTNSANDAIVMADADGKIVGWNRSAERTFGYMEAEIIGQPLTVLIPPHYRSLHTEGMRRVEAGGEHHIIGKMIEMEGLRKDGSAFPLELSLAGWTDDEGRHFYSGILRDITSRRKMEVKVRQLSLTVEQSPASVVITNTAGDIQYVNSKFTEVTGYTLEEVLGKNPRVLKSGEKSPEAYRELWQNITGGKEWHGEFHNRKKNGDLYWESASISSIRDLAGRITHYIAVKEDITVQKKAAAEREKLVTELREAVVSVKSLSGLLPICSGCKKIRDDKGYWSQVESYVQKHSEATFTHSLCPDCVKKYFPDLDES